MGEEQGFIGSSVVLVLFLVLLLRIIQVAERQPYAFGRVYGYCVFSIFFFHVLINIGMVLGLAPVIGIPLPFFSTVAAACWASRCCCLCYCALMRGATGRSAERGSTLMPTSVTPATANGCMA